MNIFRHYKASLLLNALFIALTTGCSTAQGPAELVATPEIVRSLDRYSREYVLVPGDQLEVAVYRNPDVSRTVTIGNDGNISLPLLDQVQAAGLAIEALDAEITEALSARFNNPEVTVILINPIPPMVYVYGDVGVVKPVPLREARTLAQALAYAGGATRDAALRDVALIRLDDDGFLRLMRLDEAQKGQAGPYLAYQNTALQADDLIIVPENRRSLVGRFIADFVVEPLSAVNLILTPYFQYKLINDAL